MSSSSSTAFPQLAVTVLYTFFILLFLRSRSWKMFRQEIDERYQIQISAEHVLNVFLLILRERRLVIPSDSLLYPFVPWQPEANGCERQDDVKLTAYRAETMATSLIYPTGLIAFIYFCTHQNKMDLARLSAVTSRFPCTYTVLINKEHIETTQASIEKGSLTQRSDDFGRRGWK